MVHVPSRIDGSLLAAIEIADPNPICEAINSRAGAGRPTRATPITRKSGTAPPRLPTSRRRCRNRHQNRLGCSTIMCASRLVRPQSAIADLLSTGPSPSMVEWFGATNCLAQAHSSPAMMSRCSPASCPVRSPSAAAGSQIGSRVTAPPCRTFQPFCAAHERDNWVAPPRCHWAGSRECAPAGRSAGEVVTVECATGALCQERREAFLNSLTWPNVPPASFEFDLLKK